MMCLLPQLGSLAPFCLTLNHDGAPGPRAAWLFCPTPLLTQLTGADGPRLGSMATPPLPQLKSPAQTSLRSPCAHPHLHSSHAVLLLKGALQPSDVPFHDVMPLSRAHRLRHLVLKPCQEVGVVCR